MTISTIYDNFLSCIPVERENEQEQGEEGKDFEMTEIKETEDEIQSGEGINPMLILWSIFTRIVNIKFSNNIIVATFD